MSFVTKYGTDVIRLLDFEKNRGKGGAVRMVSLKWSHVSIYSTIGMSQC